MNGGTGAATNSRPSTVTLPATASIEISEPALAALAASGQLIAGSARLTQLR